MLLTAVSHCQWQGSAVYFAYMDASGQTDVGAIAVSQPAMTASATQCENMGAAVTREDGQEGISGLT